MSNKHTIKIQRFHKTDNAANSAGCKKTRGNYVSKYNITQRLILYRKNVNFTKIERFSKCASWGKENFTLNKYINAR